MDAIRVEDLTKRFRVGIGRARIREMVPPPLDGALSRMLPRWWWKNTFNALEDVSLTVESGTSVGIVGHNGAGKTTLLKQVAGVSAPTQGRVEVNGRIAALIDLLVGFHPELTGRENVYLLGSIYGFSRREMTDRLDRIMDFAEIHEQADTPVKRYSAGMAARLGFATTASLDMEILLVDEVLAVGDASFQRKCIEWLDGFRERGGTLLFVSHNLGLVRSMTDRAVWLDHGKLVGDGSTGEVLARYARAMERRDSDAPGGRRKEKRRFLLSRGMHRWGAGGARVGEVRVEGQDQGGVTIAITYEAPTLDEGVFCVGFLDESGRALGAAASPVLPLTDGGVVRCEIRPMPLREGIYFPVVAILSPDGKVRDRWRLDRAIVREANGGPGIADDFGPLEIDASWE